MKIVRTMLSIAALLSTSNIALADLIVNGNFALGDLTGWTTVGDNSYVVETSTGIYGNNLPGDQYHVELGTLDTNFFNLSQAFATIVGQTYTFSFYINEAETTDSLQVLWDAKTLVNLSAFTTNDWQLYSFNELAGSSSSSIQFYISDNSGYVGLADVSVISAAPVPLSPTFYTFGFGLMSLLGLRIRRSVIKY